MLPPLKLHNLTTSSAIAYPKYGFESHFQTEFKHVDNFFVSLQTKKLQPFFAVQNFHILPRFVIFRHFHKWPILGHFLSKHQISCMGK